MEERIIFGPAMIPDLEIYRNPNNIIQEPHYVTFTKETIEQVWNKFHAKNYNNRVNINHDGIQVDNVEMTKSFLITLENKKELPDEFKDLPLGTWMIAYRIDNDQIWEMIKDKKLNGFSVEGIFTYSEKA